MVPTNRPRLSFTKSTRLDKANKGAKGMAVEEELLNFVVDGCSEEVKWSGDSWASRRICNNMSLLWNVKVREDSNVL